MRRAPRGYVNGPCPACGVDQLLRKGGICGKCAALIEDGKRYRTIARPSGQPYRWTEKQYAWPRFYGDYEFSGHASHPAKDALETAMFAAVNILAAMPPADTPRRDESKPYKTHFGSTEHEEWPFVLTRPDGKVRDSGYDWRTLVLLPPPVRDALNALYQAIEGALSSVYYRGKEDGRSILHQLATGEITIDSFDDALLTREERNRRD